MKRGRFSYEEDDVKQNMHEKKMKKRGRKCEDAEERVKGN